MKNIFFVFSFFILAVVLTACTKPNINTNQPVVNDQVNNQELNNNLNTMTNDQNTNSQTNTNEPVAVSKYSLTQVATHNNASDCWLVANAKVYNVTDFISKHPGGDKILNGCGKDMTEFFNTKHMKQSKESLPQFYIGDLQE